MATKTDKRHCLSKHRPEVTSCRGGVRLVLTGKNTHGKTVQTTVFLDNAFIPGLVADIGTVLEKKSVEAIDLHQRFKAAANGGKA